MIAVQRVTSRARLLELPVVFSISELALAMSVTPLVASQYAWRWRSSGLIGSLGGKSGILFNLVRDPAAMTSGTVWEQAVLKAMPSALAGGHEVLADSGISTQITHRRFLLVSNTDSLLEIDGAEIHRRPVPWLNRLAREGALDNPDPGVLVPRLRPGAALADLVVYGLSPVDPEDVDMEALTPDDMRLFRRLAKAENTLDAKPKRRPANRP